MEKAAGMQPAALRRLLVFQHILHDVQNAFEDGIGGRVLLAFEHLERSLAGFGVRLAL